MTYDLRKLKNETKFQNRVKTQASVHVGFDLTGCDL